MAMDTDSWTYGRTYVHYLEGGMSEAPGDLHLRDNFLPNTHILHWKGAPGAGTINLISDKCTCLPPCDWECKYNCVDNGFCSFTGGGTDFQIRRVCAWECKLNCIDNGGCSFTLNSESQIQRVTSGTGPAKDCPVRLRVRESDWRYGEILVHHVPGSSDRTNGAHRIFPTSSHFRGSSGFIDLVSDECETNGQVKLDVGHWNYASIFATTVAGSASVRYDGGHRSFPSSTTVLHMAHGGNAGTINLVSDEHALAMCGK